MQRALTLLVALCWGGLCSAQSLTARLTLPSGDAVAYATVVLLHDGIQAAGTATDSLGKFRLTAAPGDYTLHVSHLSSQTLYRQVRVTSGNSDMGVLMLEPAEIAVNEVVVTATAVTREADRFILSVGDAPALAGKDGVELLAQAPGVWINDNSLSINGMKGVTVFIDERELRLKGEQLISYLRGLPASDIARVEIIPQTGSEYAADARGGVLRIVLRRRMQNGINSSLSASTTQGKHLSAYAPTANLSVRAGRYTITAAGSGLLTPREEQHFAETRQYPGTTQFSGVSDMDGRSNFGSGRLGLFADLSPRHSLGIEVEYTSEHSNSPSTASTRIVQNGMETSAASRYAQHTDERTLSAAVNYIWKIDTVGSALKLLADYTRRRNAGDNDYRTQFSFDELNRDTLYRSYTAAQYAIFSAEAGLDKRFAHGIKLLAGLKYTRNRLSDDALYEGFTAPEWTPKPDYGYSLTYTEQIAAAYFSLGAGVGRWNFSAGMRGEYTATEARGSEAQHSYFGLFPSASASVGLNAMRTWMLAAQYSRNIERPGFTALNPARIQLSEYNYLVGNPALKPTYIHRLSLTLIWKYRYTLTVGGNLHRDLIREVCSTDPENADITFIRPENHYLENHWFAALSAPVQLAKNWTLTLNFVGVKQDIRLTPQSPLAQHWLMFASVTSGVNLPRKFYVELSYSGQSRLYSGNSEVAPRHLLGAALKKRLCSDRLTLSLSAYNLNGAGEGYRSTTDGMTRLMEGYSGRGGRYFKAGITWNFRSGHEVKARRTEGAADTERQRFKKSGEQ